MENTTTSSEIDVTQLQFTTQGSSLSDHGVYYMVGDFNMYSVKDVITWILDSNLQKNKTYNHLTLIITSGGGELFPAFALVDIMRGSAIPVHTIGLGVIGSAALLAFISGKKGHRIITPNTSILSHQWSWGNWGKEHELIAATRQYELMTDRMIKHYKNCTKISEKLIREKLLPAQDVWLSAEEALQYKLADEIRDVG